MASAKADDKTQLDIFFIGLERKYTIMSILNIVKKCRE